MKKLGLVLVLTVAAQMAAADGVVGHYKVKGTNPDGTAYEGDAQITATSEVTCNIVWNTAGATSKGICMRNGNAFTAGYELSGHVGLVIYLIQKDGSLEGTWTMAGENGVGTETLTPD